MSYLLLVSTVVIHRPNFFVAAALTDEIDFCFSDSLDASAEPEDDLVGKAVGDDSYCVGRGVVVILLAEHLRRGLILYVVEPSLHRNFATGRAQIAEGQHGGVRRRGIPRGKVNFGRLTRFLQRIKTFRDEIKDSGVVEVVPKNFVKSFK